MSGILKASDDWSEQSTESEQKQSTDECDAAPDLAPASDPPTLLSHEQFLLECR